MADLIREALDDFMASRRRSEADERRNRVIGAAGRFHSGARDLSEAHDKHLAEIYGK